jgi:hypothetical protein
MDQPKTPPAPTPDPAPEAAPAPAEIGGAKRSTEPTRYNDWEINGKCVDF